MSKQSLRLSRVLAAGRNGRTLPASSEALLVALLKERAAARNAGLVDLERQLREQIRQALPFRRLERDGLPPEGPLAERPAETVGDSRLRLSGEPAKRKPSRPERHRVDWPGELFWDESSIAVQLRNVSAEGGMLSGHADLGPGQEVVLALRSAGTVFATVRWRRPGAIGLKFDKSFDVAKLLRRAGGGEPGGAEPARPGILKPFYLRTEGEADSPWAARWERLRPEDL